MSKRIGDAFEKHSRLCTCTCWMLIVIHTFNIVMKHGAANHCFSTVNHPKSSTQRKFERKTRTVCDKMHIGEKDTKSALLKAQISVTPGNVIYNIESVQRNKTKGERIWIIRDVIWFPCVPGWASSPASEPPSSASIVLPFLVTWNIALTFVPRALVSPVWPRFSPLGAWSKHTRVLFKQYTTQSRKNESIGIYRKYIRHHIA